MLLSHMLNMEIELIKLPDSQSVRKFHESINKTMESLMTEPVNQKLVSQLVEKIAQVDPSSEFSQILFQAICNQLRSSQQLDNLITLTTDV